MSIVEFRGGPITHRYLMGKSKADLARMYMQLLEAMERDREGFAKLAEEATKVRDCDHIGGMDPETGHRECALGEERCLCRERWLTGQDIAMQIRTPPS